MKKFIGRFESYAYAILRIVVGFLLACHGAQKLFGVLGGNQVELASQFGVAGIIEFFGGLLILIGLFTSWAAFLCSGLMAVAYFIAHHGEGGYLPIQNGGELATVYAFLFLYMACKGGGIWSVDSKRGG